MFAKQTRTEVPLISTWTAVTIPVGAQDPRVSLESATATYRICFDTTGLNPATQGPYLNATGYFEFEGVNTAELTIYISSSEATYAILQYN